MQISYYHYFQNKLQVGNPGCVYERLKHLTMVPVIQVCACACVCVCVCENCTHVHCYKFLRDKRLIAYKHVLIKTNGTTEYCVFTVVMWIRISLMRIRILVGLDPWCGSGSGLKSEKKTNKKSNFFPHKIQYASKNDFIMLCLSLCELIFMCLKQKCNF